QYIDKSVQTLCNESTTIVTYPKYFNEKATITNENQIISKLQMNNQLTSFIFPPNNHSHINQSIIDRNGISKDNDDDNESVSKFTSSECLDIIVTPDFEMDRLKQTDYLKVQLNNNQHIGQYIDKSVQTLCNESTTIVTYPKYFNEKATITNENQIISKLQMNNQLTSFIFHPNNHSHINQSIIDRNGISKDNDDDNESVSKFTSSECLDIIVTPDFEMDRLKQTDYLKVQLNNNQHIGLDQIRQTQSFESGLNNEENYIDIDKIPATSRSYKQNKTFEPNFHYGTMEPSIHNSRKQSTLESSFETIYDQTKLCYKL
ncbi:uncharacterized protein DC041_0008210, partial [Schistosoma bovis]